MIELLLSLPDIVGAAVAMVIAAVLGLAVYLIAYKLISKYQSDELKDPTSSLFRVVGMLVSLMLSLAFADVILQMRAIENAPFLTPARPRVCLCSGNQCAASA